MFMDHGRVIETSDPQSFFSNAKEDEAGSSNQMQN